MAFWMATISTSRPSPSAAAPALVFPTDGGNASVVPTRITSLRSAAFWMLTGRLIYNLSQFGILAAMIRFCTVAAVGHFVLGLAVTAPIVMFCNLQLRVVLATDVRHEVRFADYLAVRNLMAVVAMALILAVAICAASSQVAVIIVAVGVSKLIESISDIHYGRLQRANRTNIVSRSLVIRGVTSFALGMIACAVFESAVGVCAALSICGLAVLLLHDVPASNGAKDETLNELQPRLPAESYRQMQSLVWKGLPLAVGSALMSLEANVPRYTVAAQFDPNVLAVVGIMTYALAMGQTLVTALCYPAIPRLAAHYADGRPLAFMRLLSKLCAHGGAAALLAVAAAALFGRPLLQFVLGEEFAAHSALFVLTVAAGGIQVIQLILLSALRAMRRFKVVSLVQLAGLVVTASLCIGFTRLTGVNGVGWALVASFACGALSCAALIYLSIRSSNKHVGASPY
jgi:O-antigen/teichoic acid export membrane protein